MASVKVVDDRVATERARLDRVNQRLATSAQKIASITGSSKATTVFSAAKFPAPPEVRVGCPIHACARRVTLHMSGGRLRVFAAHVSLLAWHPCTLLC